MKSRALLITLPFLLWMSLVQAGATAVPAHDGQHDFDFEIGTWKIHLKKLLHPLTGSHDWVEFEGTSYTQPVWNGRANLEQFETSSSAGNIEGLTLRLYNPASHQWSLYWATSKNGTLSIPTVGEFKDGQGEFYDQEPINGRMVLVRFIWSRMTPTSAHFEQAFSDDGGKTWEVNWITDQNRIGEAEFKALATSSRAEIPTAPGDHNESLNSQGMTSSSSQHDFDFEFGSWDAHLKRRPNPLSGSDTWVEYDGTSVVKPIWNGRADFGELKVANANGRIEGLTLRLYNPQSHQWRLYWANSKDGVLNTPTIGQFTNRYGEFFDQEDFNDKSIFVRFTFSDLTPNSFQTEQSFSPDFGKTWESNWIATFTKRN